MPTITLNTKIKAPLERVFDLARSVELQVTNVDGTKERAIAGRTAGLREKGEQVTLESSHLGSLRALEIEIVEFDRPKSFRDVMLQGDFKSFDHLHSFEYDEEKKVTLMTDEINYTAPYGIIGKFASDLFLSAYLRRFMRERNNTIKEVAQGKDWEKYLP